MGKIKSDKNNYAIPTNAMTKEEMHLMIKNAETGKFYSMHSLKEKVAKWKAKYSK